MQMVNIFNNLIILSHYFNDISFVMSVDLYRYLYDNLEYENDKFRWDLIDALTIKANEKNI
jgi:hypothetical protein